MNDFSITFMIAKWGKLKSSFNPLVHMLQLPYKWQRGKGHTIVRTDYKVHKIILITLLTRTHAQNTLVKKSFADQNWKSNQIKSNNVALSPADH